MAQRPTKETKQSSAREERPPVVREKVPPLAPQRGRPTLILVGADKGGVGKTTIARVLLDYLAANNVLTRAFDTETPRGTLYRFHPDQTSVVDLTSTSDQMKIIDTLATAEIKVSVVDVRAGGLEPALQALQDTGFLDAVAEGEVGFILFHVLGSSIASLDEIAEVAPYVEDADYFLVKNHVNDTTFFEWDPVTHRKYFEKVETAGEITIPKLNELSYEQVEIAGAPFSTFVANRTAEGEPADHSFVLRGYVRTWQNRIADEFDRIHLLDRIAGREGA
ncbi:hypothetical protein EDE12_1011158 [Methylosinus sp. sav-2]|jgi:hypothetical protein|uniref:hypothetical protein n=1 Tax=unclassified Methylosinus TaxID=2624500 RepID=UPI0004639052|nr:MULTISPECIES: hypothetical protein [unclassified Methylosinus]TDX67608.1 hypothetical protein EDE12_1011158 [Methylosinus sp. sav-2]